MRHLVAIAPNGRFVAVGFEDGALHMYSLVHGARVGEITNAHFGTVFREGLFVTGGFQINRLAFNPNGDFLASASSDGNVKLWAVASDGSLKAVESEHVVSQHPGDAYCVAFSHDGTRIASSGFKGFVGVMTLGNAGGQSFPAHEGVAASVVFDQEGHLLTAGGDGEVRLWDLNNPDSPKMF